MSTIELKWKKREGGPNWTEIDFLDFVIDGSSLFNKIKGDFASCLGWFLVAENDKAIRQLLLFEDADFSDNRRSIYVCPECGDLGCGAISAIIERVGNQIIWRDFGYQNDYDESIIFEGYNEIGPFSFDVIQYADTINQATIPNS